MAPTRLAYNFLELYNYNWLGMPKILWGMVAYNFMGALLLPIILPLLL
jgi:hypothetical protein